MQCSIQQYNYVMSSSPYKLDLSTTYKSARTPNLDILKKQIEQFRLESRYQSKRNHRHDMVCTRNVDDLDRRVDIVLRQNSHLLTQNAQLSQLLAQRTREVELLHQKLRTEIVPSPFMGQKLVFEEYQLRQQKHISQIRYLLEEVNMLHQEYGNLQQIKRIQIQAIKQQYSQQTLDQVSNLKRAQISNVEISQLQIRKLKDQLDIWVFKHDETARCHKTQILKLNGQIQQLTSQLRYIRQSKDSQLESFKRQHQQQIVTLKREISNIKQIQNNINDTNFRRIKKQLAEKQMQVQRINTKIKTLKEEHEVETMEINQQKTKIRMEGKLFEQKYKEEISQLRYYMEDISKKQLQGLSEINKQFVEGLNSEISKLYQLNISKNQEIKVLRDKLQLERDNYSRQNKNYTKQNEQLRNKLDQMELHYKAETQTLKIKISQLHYSQIHHLESYLQHQVAVLTQQILEQQKIIQDNRSKLHQEIQDKDQIRKYYEIELSKQKSKIIDLKVKLAAVSVEMKEQFVSFTSKIELTSQTLIKEADLKQKGQTFQQQQKRKLQNLINSKDKEILLLNEQLNGLKKEHILESTSLEEYIRQLKGINEDVLNNSKKEKQFYEQELKKKQRILNNQIQSLNEQLSDLKKTEYAKVKQDIETLQKENIRLSKDLENQNREHQILLQQLNLQKGNIQSMQLDSSVALEDQKNKYHMLINKNQTTLRGFFEQKLALKNKQIDNLRQQLGEKQTDLRDIISKYNDLQRKLSMAIQTIDKLSDLENRVLNLGIDNNLIKNLAELFKGSNRNKV